MDRKEEIEIRCYEKAQELLDKYFPNFIEDAAVTKPELLTEEYNMELPAKVAEDFRDWLAGVWEEFRSEVQKPFDKVLNLKRSMEITGSSYVPYLSDALEEAKTVTFWEKLTKTNHEDVTFYKGILKQYTEELLQVMIKDFMADIPE